MNTNYITWGLVGLGIFLFVQTNAQPKSEEEIDLLEEEDLEDLYEIMEDLDEEE